jgi:hypothetical protein
MGDRRTVIILHNRDPLARYRGVRPGARFAEVLRLSVDAASPQDAYRLAATLFGYDEHAATAYPRYAEDVEVYWTNALRGLRRGDVLIVDGADPFDRCAFVHAGCGWEPIASPTWGDDSQLPPGRAAAGRVSRFTWRGPMRRRRLA